MKKQIEFDAFVERVAVRSNFSPAAVWEILAAFEMELTAAMIADEQFHSGSLGKFVSKVENKPFKIERYGQPPIILKKTRTPRLVINRGFLRAINPIDGHADDQ